MCRTCCSTLRPRSVELLGMTTRGDQILDRALSQGRRQGPVRQGAGNRAGGGPRRPGRAFAEGRADGPAARASRWPACWSARTRATPSSRRATRRWQALPQGAVVGTSSLRRVVQLRALRPDLRIEPLRGNLDTRLRKLDEGGYDAIVLAAAGLKRLGLAERIRTLFDTGADAAGRRPGRAGHRDRAATATDVLRALAPLVHQPTWLAVRPSAPSAARWAAAAACRWPRTRTLRGRGAAHRRRLGRSGAAAARWCGRRPAGPSAAPRKPRRWAEVAGAPACRRRPLSRIPCAVVLTRPAAGGAALGARAAPGAATPCCCCR